MYVINSNANYMTKQKQSFLERLTGSKTLNETNQGSFPVFEEEEETEMIMHTTTPTQTMHDDSWGTTNDDGEGQLTIDVYQTDNDIIIKSTIAGVKPEDLDVSINNDMVTIKGERKNEEIVDHGNYYYQECYWGSFSRSVLLPVDVIADKTEASLKNGILTLKLPKADTTKIKKIQVRGF